MLLKIYLLIDVWARYEKQNGEHNSTSRPGPPLIKQFKLCFYYILVILEMLSP